MTHKDLKTPSSLDPAGVPGTETVTPEVHCTTRLWTRQEERTDGEVWTDSRRARPVPPTPEHREGTTSGSWEELSFQSQGVSSSDTGWVVVGGVGVWCRDLSTLERGGPRTVSHLTVPEGPLGTFLDLYPLPV